MTRHELEQACLAALDAGRRTVDLLLYGSPDCQTMRLLGRRKGPRGTVTGWKGSRVLVAFDASQVVAYLDSIPTEQFSAEEETRIVLP